MKVPYRCSKCGKKSFHDVMTLSERPLDKVCTVEGFECPSCGVWEPVFYKTISLKENLSRLEKLKIGSRQYQTLMAKTIRKANNLRQKGETNGTCQHNYMASS